MIHGDVQGSPLSYCLLIIFDLGLGQHNKEHRRKCCMGPVGRFGLVLRVHHRTEVHKL